MSSWKRRLQRDQKKSSSRGPVNRRPGWPYLGMDRGEPSLFMPVTLASGQSGLSPACRLLLAELAARNAEGGWVRLERDALAKRLGQNRRAIVNDLKALEAKGLIEVRSQAPDLDEYRITPKGEALILGVGGR